MTKKIIPIGLTILLAVSFALLLFRPVKISSPTSEVRIYSIEDELISLHSIMDSFYNNERNADFDEQLPSNALILSDSYADYAAVYLRAKVRNPGLIKSTISAVMIDAENLDDGIFVNKPRALSVEQISPLQTINEKGLTFIFICIKDMTDNEIFNYVKSIKLEALIESPIKTYSVPIDFSDATVSFYGEEA